MSRRRRVYDTLTIVSAAQTITHQAQALSLEQFVADAPDGNLRARLLLIRKACDGIETVLNDGD